MSRIQDSQIMFTSKFLKPDSDTDNFGIIRLQTEQQAPQFKKINWVLNVDRSASMSDVCPDGKTKMEHIHHTIKNMNDYFIKLNKENSHLKQYITLIAFDHETSILCDCLEITEDFAEKINTKIKELTPRGSTNIDKALRVANKHIQSIIAKYPADDAETNIYQISHMFMSDGHITQGSQDVNIIKSNCTISLDQPYNITNTYIGFGTTHDATLMRKLSDVPKGAYYFVESLENAGMVYGEILYNSLYEFIQNLRLKIENGEIYNYKTNTWSTELAIDAIASGQTRTWHIRAHADQQEDDESASAAEMIQLPVTITGTYDLLMDKKITIPIVRPSYPTEGNIDKDVEKYVWRQRTQEIMSEDFE